jgi:hypothetical protein
VAVCLYESKGRQSGGVSDEINKQTNTGREGGDGAGQCPRFSAFLYSALRSLVFLPRAGRAQDIRRGGVGPGPIAAVHRARPCPALGLFLRPGFFLVIFFSSLVRRVVVGLLRALGSGRGLLPFRQRCELCQRPAAARSGGLLGPAVSLSVLLVSGGRCRVGLAASLLSLPFATVSWTPVWCAVRERVRLLASGAAVFSWLELIVLPKYTTVL